MQGRKARAAPLFSWFRILRTLSADLLGSWHRKERFLNILATTRALLPDQPGWTSSGLDTCQLESCRPTKRAVKASRMYAPEANFNVKERLVLLAELSSRITDGFLREPQPRILSWVYADAQYQCICSDLEELIRIVTVKDGREYETQSGKKLILEAQTIGAHEARNWQQNVIVWGDKDLEICVTALKNA